jgi:predicted Zn-dependent protease with MMP-like domain
VSPVDGEDDPAAGQADGAQKDPAWRLTAWLLPAGAGASALLTLGQTVTGGLGRVIGYPAALALALLCVALVRDARRRAVAGRWVRAEVYEFALPLTLLLVTLVLLARGADLITCAPALLALIPVTWAIAHAPHVIRVRGLLPRALPVLNQTAAVPTEAEDVVEQIVRDVLDGLPPDIAAQLDGWSIEVRDEMLPRPADQIVYGCCFGAAHVIAIYRRPHLLYNGRGASLRPAVTYTVLHEIGHALGLDETGVRRLGWLVDNRQTIIGTEGAGSRCSDGLPRPPGAGTGPC